MVSHLLTCSLTHLLTYSLTHLLTYSLTRPEVTNVLCHSCCRYDEKATHSAFYEALNSEKKNVIIDLKDIQQRDQIKKLIRSYDVVVEGNRPGVMDRLGLGYDDLKQENPGLIYCSISGYGASGPLSQ
jgi:crotonobetainyl-CoA:carnitine CoA-transferase CaiB-like acyl-CoA transferase